MCGLVKLNGRGGPFIPVEAALRVLNISAAVEIETTTISESKHCSIPHAATVVWIDAGMIPEIATADFRYCIIAAILPARMERICCHWISKKRRKPAFAQKLRIQELF